jgi:hypothetical protein
MSAIHHDQGVPQHHCEFNSACTWDVRATATSQKERFLGPSPSSGALRTRPRPTSERGASGPARCGMPGGTKRIRSRWISSFSGRVGSTRAPRGSLGGWGEGPHYPCRPPRALLGRIHPRLAYLSLRRRRVLAFPAFLRYRSRNPAPRRCQNRQLVAPSAQRSCP